MRIPRSNLTARAGRWSATHRKAAIGGWLAFVVLAVVLGGLAGFDDTGGGGSGGSSDRADAALQRAFDEQPVEHVIVERRDVPATDARFRDAVDDVVARVRAADGVASATVDRRAEHAVLIQARLSRDDADGALAATRAAADAHPGFFVGQFGEASLDTAMDEAMEEDMGRAELLSLPVTLIILLFAFGSILAAVLPLLLSMTAVAAALGLVQLVSQLTPMEETVNSVVLLIGLAVGVDYCLFYVRRARDERRAGRGRDAAVTAAAATSGRAVLVSGVTVMIAVAGQYLAGNDVFTALATGSIIVVAVALLASLTVLPALLSLLGDRVLVGRRTPRPSRVWGVVLGGVLRRPAVALVAGVAVLGALAVPALGLHTAMPGMDTVTDRVAVKPAYDRIEAAFPGGGQPADVVVEARDVTAPPVREAIARLGGDVRVSTDRRVAAVAVPLPGDGTNAASVAALRELRRDTIPAAFAGVPGAEANVTGTTAENTDFRDRMAERAPLVFAFVLGLAFLVLLATFRSLVVPLKAIALNLLSVGAAYGVLELVYWEGQGTAITAWLPMFLFVVLFGLSMDYHVFIVSRIRELHAQGRPTVDAVGEGIRGTASVVTSAAAIMVAVFAVFGTLSTVDMQQMGVGLATAVLIDATIVRGVLLPSAMALLGRWNWWLPGRPVRRERGAVASAA